MSYKSEIKDYKQKAIEVFKNHLIDLETNVIEASKNELADEPVSKIYVDYQESTLKLIEGKIEIDNEFLKKINIQNLEKYKDIDPEKFEQIRTKIVDNHKRVIEELKENYEELAKESRENLKYQLAEIREDNDLNVSSTNPEEFFPEKLNVLTLNFVIIFGLLALIIGLIYYYNFM